MDDQSYEMNQLGQYRNSTNEPEPYVQEKKCCSKLGNALEGIYFAFKTDKSFKILFVYLLILLIPLITFAPNIHTKALTIVIYLTSFVFELVNTVFEITIDRIGYEYNILSGKAKDVSAGISLAWQLIVIIFTLYVGLTIYYDYQIWSDDFRNLNMYDYIKQTFVIL